MAKKKFTNNNPFKGNPNDRFAPDNKPMEDQIELVVDQPEEQKPAEQPKVVAAEQGTPKAPKKQGRPKNTEPTDQRNIRLPISLLDQIDPLLPVMYGGSLSKYIGKLIKKDLKENYEKYLSLLDDDIE